MNPCSRPEMMARAPAARPCPALREGRRREPRSRAGDGDRARARRLLPGPLRRPRRAAVRGRRGRRPRAARRRRARDLMAGIAFDHVSKRYPDGTLAVDDLDIAVEDHEFMIFVGPSGCGKTTALRMVAGLEEVTTGEIRLGGMVL